MGEESLTSTLLWIALFLLLSRLATIVRLLNQPAVLGQLLIGVLLGNLGLLGIGFFEQAKSDHALAFLAELGVIVLLFQVGLESNIQRMRQVGARALAVATIGVVLPFVLGTYLLGPLLYPELGFNSHLFLGAALTATSVGITAAVLKYLGKLDSKAGRIILGAAVIDDVLGLIILAIVSSIVSEGTINAAVLGLTILKAVAFLAGCLVAGRLLAITLGRFLPKISPGMGMLLALALGLAFGFAFLADLVGLAPIVGAFAAGLVLEPTHFRRFEEPAICTEVRGAIGSNGAAGTPIDQVLAHHTARQVQDAVEPLVEFLAPLFFVYTGLALSLESLSNMGTVLIVLAVTAVALLGKAAAGLVAGKGDRAVVGAGMIPRGEVGIIFAVVGKELGVVPENVFSMLIVVVLLTTVVTPPLLSALVRRADRRVSKPAQPTDDSN